MQEFELEFNILGITKDKTGFIVEKNGLKFELNIGHEIDVQKFKTTYKEKTGKELEFPIVQKSKEKRIFKMIKPIEEVISAWLRSEITGDGVMNEIVKILKEESIYIDEVVNAYTEE